MNEIEILFEDNDIVCLLKPYGAECEKEIPQMLKEKCGEIYPVHRLDALTRGVMVYAKTKKSAAFLSKEINDNNFKKEYLAVVSGTLSGEGVMEDELFFDRQKRKSFVSKKARNGTKHAKLEYFTLANSDDLTLVLIKLITGRTHQIRVQFSSRGFPLYADGKYGDKHNGKLNLFCKSISFTHPTKHTNIHISESPCVTQNAWNLFCEELNMLQN